MESVSYTYRKQIPLALFFAIFFTGPPAHAGLLWNSDFCECFLDKIQAVKNDFAADVVWSKCMKDFVYENYYSINPVLFYLDSYDCKSKSSSWFGMTVRECFMKYGSGLQGFLAPRMVSNVCQKRYGK
jgi:hypothetical protein